MPHATCHIVTAEQIQLDISAHFNFDAVATQAEVDQANTHVGVNHRLTDVFSAAGSGEWYKGVDHYFANQYTQLSYWHNATTGAGLSATITSPYGTYTLGAFDTPTNITSELGTGNAIRIGTKDGSIYTAPEGQASITINLIPAQQDKYAEINLLMTGRQVGYSAYTTATKVTNCQKLAWTEVWAIYEGNISNLVWTSPRGDIYEGTTNHPAYGDDRDEVAGGIPSVFGYEVDAGYLEQAYKDSFNQVEVIDDFYHATGGADPERFSYGRAADSSRLYMYDIAGGIAIDPKQTLTGIYILLNNGPNLWITGYPYGDNINIYAINVAPPPPPPGTVLTVK